MPCFLLPVDAEADNAIEIALERTRKLLNAKREGPEGGGAAKVARILQQAPQIKQEAPFSEGGVGWLVRRHIVQEHIVIEARVHHFWCSSVKPRQDLSLPYSLSPS